jgi:glycerate kinase
MEICDLFENIVQELDPGAHVDKVPVADGGKDSSTRFYR